ncbi:G-protein coupled receptor 4-like [Protopterus annectens]|uniref:G-protein coupled receptor 4-like n=1 Tax=Protopterus annectens TaxID=7888 RepID=UPI001CF96C85|nr:G-protein coupled receptor 4-like [Protopterus annectens]XP_043934280.1 G-protein coupled receptor 4-like [Protopterus annectens]
MTCNCTNMTNLQSDKYTLTAFYSFTFITGLPANCLALWGLIQLRKSKQNLPVFLFNLVVSDLLQIMILPFWIHYVIKGHDWTFGKEFCVVSGYIFYVNLYTSIGFLCAISIDRYLAIVHPFRFQDLHTPKSAILVSVAVWTFMIVFCWAGLGSSLYNEPLCFEKYPVTERYAAFKIVTIVIGFIFPCLILGFTFLKIRNSIRKSPSLSNKEKLRLTCLFFIILVIFIGIFGPYHILGSYKFTAYFVFQDCNAKCNHENNLFLSYRICYGLTSLNNILDPLIYIFICDDVQKQFQECFSFIPKSRDVLESTNSIHMGNSSNINSGHHVTFQMTAEK